MEERKFFTTRNITYLAVLLALVIVFQMLANFMVIGTTQFNLALVPVAIGGMLLGWGAGVILGLVLGAVIIVSSLANPLVALILAEYPFYFVVVTLLRGVLTGVVPALIFKPIAKRNVKVASVVSSVLTPIVNTGVFILGILPISGLVTNAMVQANEAFSGQSTLYIIIIGIVGINFFVELAISAILSPATYTVISVVNRRRISS